MVEEASSNVNCDLQNVPSDFKFITSNIPGDEKVSDSFEEQFHGCSCDDGSCVQREDCNCVWQWGRNYTIQGLILPSVLFSQPAKPMLECNSQCPCPPKCFNRLVQRGPTLKLHVFPTERKGLGLQSLEAIPAFSFVCEYAGEALSYETAKARAQSLKTGDMNYLITLKEHCASGVYKTYIDPTYFGNIGRFINHSCEPNLVMIPVRVDNNVPKLALFAARDIPSMEELSFDYSGGDSKGSKEAGTKGVDQSQKIPCLCGAKKCKGWLPFDASLFQK